MLFAMLPDVIMCEQHVDVIVHEQDYVIMCEHHVDVTAHEQDYVIMCEHHVDVTAHEQGYAQICGLDQATLLPEVCSV